MSISKNSKIRDVIKSMALYSMNRNNIKIHVGLKRARERGHLTTLKLTQSVESKFLDIMRNLNIYYLLLLNI